MITTCRLLASAVALFAVVAAGGLARGEGPDFGREVRPILANRCFKCHGPDDATRQGGLRLDRRDDALAAADSGNRAIVPGHADDSELVARINSADADVVMPPPDTKGVLTPDEKQILTAWIATGAPYAEHWAFGKPVRPPVPKVADAAGAAAPVNPIDFFVRDRLARDGLRPSPEADRAKLCRRVHLDLIGLPPTPAELDTFVADGSPDAYEKLVDRLLASPRYGERWARRWLDLARYADTNGYEKDRERRIWPYRDWVIRALNDDMPFDAFTRRQIAGDLLPGAAADDIIATGFHRNTMINEEGGIDPLEFRYLAMVDRVSTTGVTWLGLTTGCAQCHNHKYDPLTQADYYGLFACLDNADEPEWVIPDAEQAKAVADATTRLETAWSELPGKWPLVSAAEGQPAPRPLEERYAGWERDETAKAIDWHVVKPQSWQTSMPHLVVRDDGSILASGDVTKSDRYEIVLPAADIPIEAIRLEVLPDPSLPAYGPGLAWYEGPKGDFFLSELEITAGGARVPVAVASDSFNGTAAFSGGKSTAALALDGDMSSGWSTNGDQGRPHAAVFALAEPVPPGTPIRVVMKFERHYACPLGCFRLSITGAKSAEARGLTAPEEATLRKPAAERTDHESMAVRRRFLASAPELVEPMKEIRGLEAQLRGGPTTLVLRERPADNPRKTFLRHRGEYTQARQEIAPAVPAFLPGLPPGASANRLALAEWLVSGSHPLTARVTVNRQWQAFFGRGIVPTLEDFGYQGTPPSHPDLLDWLATTFVDDLGWSLKKLHRLIVTSATYCQASSAGPEQLAADPANILLARGPRVRLEAEQIRDGLLRAAGILSEKMYGPGVRPPQPAGVTETAYGGGAWEPSPGEDRHRRSLYTFQKRTAPFAFVTTFDGPSGDSCLARRDVSNSALQALTLMNDPMFVEVARALGAAALSGPGDDAARLDDLGRRVLSRPFAAGEREALLGFLRVQRERLAAGELDATKLGGEGGGDPVDRAAWMLVARAVMNLDETVVKR
ncbi:MAG: PSD1 and planctomycete cytochrome C domain-containing protein [Planctomycetota bacterium]|nr:PSD1 and planctomycete cytochrome C domain-containing protein [Planctomycetota bacterium]